MLSFSEVQADIVPPPSVSVELKSSAPTKPSTLQANFVMTRTIDALKSDLKSEGRVILGGEGLLRWETIFPSKAILVVNNKKGWIHYPDLNVSKSFDVSHDPVMRILSEHLPALTAGRFDEINSAYEISSPEKNTKHLVPKSQEIKKLFKEIRVKIDNNGNITNVVLVSANNDTTDICFNKIVRGADIGSSLFSEPK